MSIQPGQIYVSLGDPYPYTEPRRIRIVSEPVTTPGLYGFGKVQVFTVTESGREIRQRRIELSQLHATDTTETGAKRRAGYALEAP
jgi:hypothetical protein